MIIENEMGTPLTFIGTLNVLRPGNNSIYEI